jgi:amino acid transporter
MREQSAPPRVIGLAGAVLINLNGVVGAGIFALPALLYAGAGGLAPLVVLAYALVMVPPLLVVAKLSTVFEQSGGPQLYVEHAFGSFVGFQTGIANLSLNMAGRAANFHVLVSYLAAMFPVFEPPLARLATMLGLIALVTVLSVVGTRRSIKAMWVGTALKLGPILAICVVGLVVNGMPTAVALPEFTQVESIALLLAYAYSGCELSTVAAGEMKDPRRTVYRSIFVNLAVIALFYAFVQWAYIAIDPQSVDADRPLASAGEAVFGHWGVIAISVAAIFSIGTNQLSSFVAIPRLLFGMGQRGLLPAYLAHVSSRFLTPANAIITYSLFVALLALSGTFATLATLSVALETLSWLLVIVALPVMWYRGEFAVSKARAIGWLGVIVAAILFNLWLLMQVPANSALPTLVALLVGAALYELARRVRVRRDQASA